MMRNWQWCGVAILALGAQALMAAELTLVKDGRPAAVIVLPPRSSPLSPASAPAAKVLIDHLAQMSGATLPMKNEGELKARVQDGRIIVDPGQLPSEITSFVLLGEGELARQLGMTSAGLVTGGVRLKTSGNAVGLIGSTASGDTQTPLWAVLECLEELGCRYLWPGETGKVVPKRTTVTLANLDHSFSPPVQQRNIRFMGMSERPESGLKRLGYERPVYEAAFTKATQTTAPISWAVWHRQGGNVGVMGGAAGAGLRGGWKEHGAKHPEWFALQPNGTRDQSKAGDRWRLCVSNLELIEHVANDVIQRANENPKLMSVSLCPNDGGFSSFCLCENCKKLDPPDAPKIKMLTFLNSDPGQRKEIEGPALTDRFVWYWNQIAQRVTKVHPNLLILAEAYSYYSTPPVREKLHPNIVIRYVPSTTEGWEGWQKAGTKRIYWRPNILLAGRKDGMVSGLVNQLATQMAYMADNGMFATDFDSIIHNWAVHGLNYYAAARLNWNPHLTADQIIDDYSKHGFGPAADSMGKYYRLIEELTRNNNRVFTTENLAALRGLLNAAEQAAANDAQVRARLAFVRIGLNYTEVHATLNRMAEEAKKGPAQATAAKAAAQPLLDLNFLMLRDIVKNHNLAISASYLVWAGGEFSLWEPVGGRGYRPSDAILALNETHSMTGKENSIEELKAAFGLAQSSAKTKTATPGKPDLKTTIDADEQGRPVEVLK